MRLLRVLAVVFVSHIALGGLGARAADVPLSVDGSETLEVIVAGTPASATGPLPLTVPVPSGTAGGTTCTGAGTVTIAQAAGTITSTLSGSVAATTGISGCEGCCTAGAHAVSADGSVIAGFSHVENSSPSELQTWRWTAATGKVALGDLPGGPFRSVPFDISSDGSVIVGHGKGEGLVVEGHQSRGSARNHKVFGVRDPAGAA